MKRLVLVGLLSIAVVFPSSIATAASGQTFTMTAENGSKESGTVTLTPILGGTRVSIKLANEEEGVIQPAHIHAGGCRDAFDAGWKVIYPLKNVVRGHSTTIIKNVPPEQLMGNYAVNVHKSKAQITAYVSCANLK